MEEKETDQIRLDKIHIEHTKDIQEIMFMEKDNRLNIIVSECEEKQLSDNSSKKIISNYDPSQ